MLRMMVGLILKYSECAINLFNHEQAYHLVREGHFGKTDHIIGSLVDQITKTVRSPYYEHQLLGTGIHLFLHIS